MPWRSREMNVFLSVMLSWLSLICTAVHSPVTRIACVSPLPRSKTTEDSYLVRVVGVNSTAICWFCCGRIWPKAGWIAKGATVDALNLHGFVPVFVSRTVVRDVALIGALGKCTTSGSVRWPREPVARTGTTNFSWSVYATRSHS